MVTMLNFIRKITPKPLFSLYHLTLAWLGNSFFSAPSQKLFLIGVTGTKGKTTTAYFIYQLLEMAGRKTALTSTTFFALDGRLTKNYSKMGMPGRFFLPRWLKKAVTAKAEFAVVETTSEGIAQHRQKFLDYNVAVFTSLSPEHVERHGSFAAYQAAKERLFAQTKGVHVVNLDDRHAREFLQYSAEEKWGITLGHKNRPAVVQHRLEGDFINANQFLVSEITLSNGQKNLVTERKMKLPFPGKFNGVNLLLAIGAVRAAGITWSKIAKNIGQLRLPPGRMQELTNLKTPYRVFLDYAHEPLSLRSALETCRELLPAGKKLICLTGAQGGGRDIWKRKVMGRTAAGLCDYVVVGTEDPYEEDPSAINLQVLQGVLSNPKFKENKNCWQFADRRNAIKKALKLAQKDDLIILCGKGGEQFMCVENKKISWDEEKEVKNAVAKLELDDYKTLKILPRAMSA
jgi:UDP-N-acetylmuramoyl-L-alanyl-D-glutamate--2,6-diaminopimelate ligase